jgi:ABC-2 type transport system ATP-binding protein
MLHLLATLLRPSRGHARVFGHDVVRESTAVRRSIGLVFQETTLDRDLSAEENLRFAARLWNLPERPARVRIDELLRAFSLYERRRHPVRALSGGMRRALELARGLLHRPRLLFLDEPTAGLDPRARRALWDSIGELRASQRITVFLTTHYVEEADPCDRVAILDHGRIVALDVPSALKRRERAATLEDVFLALTGRALPEPHAPAAAEG